jgi:hypothetical protein
MGSEGSMIKRRITTTVKNEIVIHPSAFLQFLTTDMHLTTVPEGVQIAFEISNGNLLVSYEQQTTAEV